MKKEVEAWQKGRNDKNKKINWQFTTKDARVKLKSYIRHLVINITIATSFVLSHGLTIKSLALSFNALTASSMSA